MAHFVQRDFNRTPEDDWKINIQPYLGEYSCSERIYIPEETDQNLVGWVIKPQYE